MPALALAVMGIAIPDSLNPSLIVAAICLALGAKPFRRTLALTSAAFAVTLAGSLTALSGGGVGAVPRPKLFQLVFHSLQLGRYLIELVHDWVLAGESPLGLRSRHEAAGDCCRHDRD